MLEQQPAHTHNDLVGDLARLKLTRPTLYALAEQPLRHVDLETTLVAATGEAVHFRTLGRALTYLRAAGLITRHAQSTRHVVYEITKLGSDLIASLEAANRLAHEHQLRAGRKPANGPAAT